MSLQCSDSRGDDLPRPAAKVDRRVTKALARWVRALRLSITGGAGVGSVSDQEQLEDDAARLYQEGWALRQVARRFGYSDVVMRRILRRRTNLRRRPRRRQRPPSP
jgi:hypothetical protein